MRTYTAATLPHLLQDIMNEPDSMGMGWEAANGKPGARELYLATMDSLHTLSPTGWLYVVEGAGQNAFGLNWVSLPARCQRLCEWPGAVHWPIGLASPFAHARALRATWLHVQGNGFITDANIIRRYGLSNANPFFTALLAKPYADQV